MKKSNLLIIIFLTVLNWASFASIQADAEEGGLKRTINNTEVEIKFYSPEIVRIIKSAVGNSVEKESLSVIKEPENVTVKIDENNNEITISSSSMVVRVNKNTGVIKFANADDKILITEKTEGTIIVPKKYAGVNVYNVKQSFQLDPEEFIYGLGQLQRGKMSQRNQEVFLKQNNKETVIPFILSAKGYGLFWDNYSPTTFSDTQDETYFDSEIGECIDYYVMFGGNADGVVGKMRELTGDVPMFPYWSYGYWQSRERYKSQFETVEVVKKYRELEVPLDGIIQDWRYWGEDSVWNRMAFDSTRFPDPKAMVDQVHDMNAHLMIVTWPGFGPLTKQYQEFKSRNMQLNFLTWPPNSGTKPYDVYNPTARDIYWKYLNKGVFSYINNDGWWLDSSEPDHIEVKDEDFEQPTYLGPYRSVVNAFPLEHIKGVSTHQRETTDKKRVFILTRSAFAGQQRYGANSWSGDVVTDWDILRKQISAGLNLSLCGIPHWNSDIGGFFVWNFPGGVDNKAFHEIYVRWLQFGSFCPMMRSHGTDTPREIYQFGEKGDWTYDAIEKFINMRYRLLPYTYSTSWDVSANRSSMIRALVMDFAEDEDALDIDNQYMFGKSILVCPVTQPMYVKTSKDKNKYIDPKEDFSKIKSSEVYLPSGTVWIDFWNGEKFNGGQTISRKAPIDIIPLFIKAGSIIPWNSKVQYASEKKATNLEIRIYPGADGEFTLYEDEGDNYNYENGDYSTIGFSWNDKTRTLNISERKGEFSGMLKNRQFKVVIVEKGSGTGIEESEKNTIVEYNGNDLSISL
ncbi:TIM-barrel domain-containing protein [Draconibacterium sediminis]|uniref:glycoside hydrolase family 31 protein n=1 Tax=Draconibacterium sediminis TaxID=1544798 RepID=UPI0026F06E6F|nr:TIM-barrel domain-containing protein [Draconibacterium sediminis]